MTPGMSVAAPRPDGSLTARSPSVSARPVARQCENRACSRYVRYTAWLTCPIGSQSRNRTSSRCTKIGVNGSRAGLGADPSGFERPLGIEALELHFRVIRKDHRVGDRMVSCLFA